MSRHDWHREREKYLDGAEKQPNPASPPPVQIPIPVPIPVPVPNPEPDRAPVSPSSSRKVWLWGSVLVLLIVLLGGGYFLLNGDSSTRLAQAAEKYKSAVGLVTLKIEFKNGGTAVLPIGTAWCFAERSFATNGHVANGIRSTLEDAVEEGTKLLLKKKAAAQGCASVDELLEKLGSQAEAVVAECRRKMLNSIRDAKAEIIINETQNRKLSISHVQIHKAYDQNSDQFSPDVAVLTTVEKNESRFPVADAKTLAGLKSGEPVAFLGFPMENLHSNNVVVSNPVASMQSGIIVAVSGFDLKDAGQKGNFLLRHNLPATGGASGSPLFNKQGEVVGVVNAINVVGQVRGKSGSGLSVSRAPSGAQINFAIRADQLSGMDAPVTIKDFMK